MSLNKEKICCEISEDKIAVCEKTQGLRSGNFSDLNTTVAQKCKTQNKQSKTKITFLYHFYTILIHFYPKHETQLTILSHNFLFCDTLENTKHIWNHKTHLEITKHIGKSQNTFGNHKTHLESQNTFRNHKTHLESYHKTHLESQNTFRITKHI